MNEGVQGLFSGIGNAMAETGRQGTKDYFQKSRLKMRQRLNAEAAQEDREFQKNQSQTEYERQKELAKMEDELARERSQEQFERKKELARERTPEKLDPRVDAKLERVSGQIDYYNKMIEQVETGGPEGLAAADIKGEDKAAKLSNLRQARDIALTEYNSLIDGTAAQGETEGFVSGPVVEKAREIPEEDEGEYLSALEENPYVPQYAKDQVKQYFASRSSGKPEPDPEPRSGERRSESGQGQQQESQQEQPQSGQRQGSGFLQQFLQGQGNEQSETRVPFRSGANQGQSEQNEGQSQGEPQTESTEQSGGVQDNRLGPAIERGISSIMSWPDRLEKAQKQRSISNMEEIARKGGTESKQEKNQFLGRDVKYINELSPELQNRLIEIFGEETLKPYLNQE